MHDVILRVQVKLMLPCEFKRQRRECTKSGITTADREALRVVLAVVRPRDGIHKCPYLCAWTNHKTGSGINDSSWYVVWRCQHAVTRLDFSQPHTPVTVPVLHVNKGKILPLSIFIRVVSPYYNITTRTCWNLWSIVIVTHVDRKNRFGNFSLRFETFHKYRVAIR